MPTDNVKEVLLEIWVAQTHWCYGHLKSIDFCWNRIVFWAKASAVIYFKVQLSFPADDDG